MTKRVLAWVSAIAICMFVAVGCGGGSEGGGDQRFQEEIVIGWTPPDITGVFQTATNYFEQAAKEANSAGFNVTIESRSPETHTNFGDQIQIIENFISQDVDVIAVSPADTEAIKPAIRRANEAGIPVIVVNLLEPQKGMKAASYIGFDNSEAAAVTAYSVLDYYGGPGVLGTGEKMEVAPDQELDLEWWRNIYDEGGSGSQIEASGTIIEGIAGTFFSQARLTGFRDVVDQYDGVKILGNPIAADWNREKGTSAAENFLSRYGPQEMDFIWGASSEMALGAMSALEQRGVLDSSGGDTPPQEGKVAVFSNDVTPETANEIRNGKIIAETHHGFAEWGWFGTKFGVKLACGQDVPKTFDIRPRTAWEGNVDQFYPDVNLPEIDWQAIKNDC